MHTVLPPATRLCVADVGHAAGMTEAQASQAPLLSSLTSPDYHTEEFRVQLSLVVADAVSWHMLVRQLALLSATPALRALLETPGTGFRVMKSGELRSRLRCSVIVGKKSGSRWTALTCS